MRVDSPRDTDREEGPAMKDKTRGRASLTSVTSDSHPNRYLPARWQKVVPNWHSEEPDESEAVDLVLQVMRTTHVTQTGSPFPPSTNFDLCAGQSGLAGDTHGYGVLQITFDATRVVYADLRNGRFSLGSWNSVVVEATLWGGGSGQQADTFEVLAWVEPAADGEWLRYTMPVARGDAFSTFRVPPGAQFVDLLAAQQEAAGPVPKVHWGDPNAPKYVISGRAESAVHDYAGNALTPSNRPLNLRGMYSDAAITSNVVTVAKDTGDDLDLQVVFYVR
jgi:hypothetical protein